MFMIIYISFNITDITYILYKFIILLDPAALPNLYNSKSP